MKLGTLLSASGTGPTLVTLAGYQVSLTWAGGFAGSQIFWTGSTCGNGTAYMNAGGSTGKPAWGRQVYASTVTNELFVVSSTDANGQATCVSITPAYIENPGCVAYGSTTTGWLLQEVTHSSIGLPASIAGPVYISGY